MRDYLQLAKPRITLFVLITTWIGYHMAGGKDKELLVWVLLATALASATVGINR